MGVRKVLKLIFDSDSKISSLNQYLTSDLNGLGTTGTDSFREYGMAKVP